MKKVDTVRILQLAGLSFAGHFITHPVERTNIM
jgi:hypothetical protein